MSAVSEPIAIIGSGCRFPGESSSPSKLWSLLVNPRDVLSKVDRFAADSFFHENGHHHGTSNVLHSYLLSENTRSFDAPFFNIPGGEAESIDPQQRFLMEVIYEALESAGQKIEHLSGTATGVYVGVMCNDFSQITYADIENVPKYAATGTALSILSNRISYFFNWTGPSMTIDTACSSSLIAVHQAVQLLRSGQSNLAVAAGSNLIFTPTNYIAESNVNMLSPTGRSRMWDAGADGYARGEGVACVVLKRLSDAIADGDVIESIIRETGTNQDGRTPGITMPSSTSQAALIRQTYARAGLDPTVEADRCQYFEAHGTGTKAGDPQEASAIYQAFCADRDPDTSKDVLYVGSIKTVIGHTEGTAGIAGLLKASLSVQNGIIPANMLFTELNPDIEQYYGPLQIPTSARKWPLLPAGVPRRASVNSFGFGGANAHAIIENYVHTEEVKVERNNIVAIPFVFSAYSEKALTTQLKTFVEYVEHAKEETTARDVSWTLSRKSAFAHRAAFSASTLEGLRKKLVKALDAKDSDSTDIGVRPSSKKQKILGIFTGQGAQWPMMGYKLLQSSAVARSVIARLDQSLQDLPVEDRPTWSLVEELSKTPDNSRVMQAEFSQPLCTAVQVLLVDILHTSGLKFDAVVGHSSGEIAAAYASGYISASDAIRIAYYRGLLGNLATANGAMLAVGTSMEDATELCHLPVFRGRLNVAANNSSASVTLSGDKKAIERALFILEDEGKFARMLKVDKAYHSHHMEPCAEPYMQAMSRVKVEAQHSPSSCKWFSSVFGNKEMTNEMSDVLSGSYWKDNLLQSVLFSQALETALEDIGTPGLVVEVGPHPALKGPASLVIEEKCGSGVQYTGVLARNSDDVEALSQGIGAFWCNIDSTAPRFADLDTLFARDEEDKPSFLKSVPTYTWDHERTYWKESRVTKALFERPKGHHELLGVRLDGSENEFRWRNFIKPSEMPWLNGHQVQGQVVFPGAGFASLAFEACKALASPDEISLIELLDLRVSRAMALTDDNVGVESFVSLSDVVYDENKTVVFCNYECSICPTPDSNPVAASTGRIRLELGSGSCTSLPPRCQSQLDMNDVDMEHFYSSLSGLGYNYSDMFKGISSLKRTTDSASGIIYVAAADNYNPPFTFHPAPLDVAFQSVFGALGAPGDGRLWTILVPTLISRIKINPHACQNAGLRCDLPFDSVISVSPSNGVTGDVDVFDQDGNTLVQVEGLHVSPLTTAIEEEDRQVFSVTEWGLAEPDATKGFSKWKLTEEARGHMVFTERACFFYMKRFYDAVTPEERANLKWHPKKYLSWVSQIVEEVSTGQHPIAKKEWMNDTWEEMSVMMEYISTLYKDFRILMVVGDNLIPWVRGEVDFLELYRETGMLEHIYKNTYGFPEYNAYLGATVKQLSHRHRQMDILEIGAGTGSATEAIMRRIGDSYGSYTYTDISAGFFIEAQEIFKAQNDKFIYSTFDVERNPIEQGYTEHSYDLIVASNVLHATKSLETTLSNARKLLKPGGYLIILEITDVDPLRPTFFFGTLPGWWVGEADGRPHHPLVTQKGWDSVLRRTGFSGLDTATPPSGEFMVPQSIMVTQAVDTQMRLIRQPLAPDSNVTVDNVLVLGGQSLSTFQLQEEIMDLLQPMVKNVTCVEKIELLEESHFTSKQIVLSLLELDESVFNPFTPAKWAAIQLLTGQARDILWITQGGRGEEPYANMIVGVARCLTGEKPDMRFQVIDFDVEADPEPTTIAEAIMQMQISDAWASFVEPYNPTWTLEREIRIVDGEKTIPRYIASTKLNDRYNSSHRNIHAEASTLSSRVSIVTGEASYDLQEITTPAWMMEKHTDLVEIQVQRSSLVALNLGAMGSLFLLVGKASQLDRRVLAFSQTNTSKVFVPRSWMIACDGSHEEDTHLLLAAFCSCLSELVLSRASPGTSLLVHEPAAPVAAMLKEAAAEHHVTVRFTSSRKENTGHGLDYIHPSTPGRIISNFFPKDLTLFVDLSSQEASGGIAARIEKHLPHGCEIVRLTDLIRNEAFLRPFAMQNIVTELLDLISRHIARPNSSDKDLTTQFEEVGIADITGRRILKSHGPMTVVDWTSHSTVPVRVSPPEDMVQFRPDKTYWLMGLTGELGLSLCQWMVKRGARYVALSSRAPKVSEKWLEHVQSNGAEVRFLACDATNRRSVMQTYQAICKTMPPIAGVANGAMVLNDGIIAQQSYEKFNGTLRPKVDGTKFLNEIFDKPTLDFFIVFSSLAYVTGNIGQSSYAAANAFMASVVEGRRKRGLAGSIINLAGIFGIGYITRTNRGILERLGKMGYSNVSEWDFLQFFAEAVLAGNPLTSAGLYHEVSSSLRPYDPNRDENPPDWLEIPRFSYYKRAKAHASGLSDGKDSSVRAQLKEQTTKEGVYNVLLAALTAKLYKQLGLRPEDNSIAPHTRLVDLGIDSLVAVDMRFWFTKELDLDMPVLKLLGGASVEEMVEDTIERLSPALTPNAQDAGGETASSRDPVSVEPVVSDATTPVDTSDATNTDDARSSVTTEPSLSHSSDIDDQKQEIAADVVFERKMPMSYPSLQFWFLMRQLDQDAPFAFNVTFRVALKGRMDVGRMSEAVRKLGKRHDALRTAFFDDPDNEYEPVQAILPVDEAPLHLEILKVADLKEAIAFHEQLDQYTYDLQRGRTIRMALLSENDVSHYLILGFHHIAMDGFSFDVLLRELTSLYEGKEMPPMEAQWNDFMAKQRLAVENGSLSKEVDFWRTSLGQIPDPIPMLPMARFQARVPITRFAFEQPPMITLDEKIVQAIRERCRVLKVTRFHFFMAVLRVMLFALTDVDELCIGTVDAGRPDNSSAKMIGLLVNIIPLKFRRKEGQSFTALTQEARDKAYAALAHSKLPFKALLDQLAIPRATHCAPLFQVVLDYLPHKFESPKGLGTPGDEVQASLNYSLADMVLDVNDISSTEIRLRWRAQTSLYSLEGTQILLDTYAKLVKTFAAVDPDLPLNDKNLDLYNPVHVQVAVETSLGLPMQSQWSPTVSHVIEENCLKSPNALAIRDGYGNSLTYTQTSRRIDQIAAALMKSGMKHERIAGYLKPSVDWVCSLLAVWKIGAAFVSLDSKLPASRIATLLSISKPSAILCHLETSEAVTTIAHGDTIVLDVTTLPLSDSSSQIISTRAKSDQPALINFTSGSTGAPKGVELRHSNIVNVIEGLTNTYQFDKEALVTLQQSAQSFDICYGQVLLGLCNRGSVFVVPTEKRGDPQEICKLIRDEKVTLVMSTPAEYSHWLQFGKAELLAANSWKYGFSGGEALSKSIMVAFKDLGKQITLINAYGPTETFVLSTTTVVDYNKEDLGESKEAIPIGKPLPNHSVFVVSKDMRPVPIGVTGEIVITGPGVANGYYEQAELTQAAFVPDTLTPTGHFPRANNANAKMYRTGDSGRYGQDGQLYFEGRLSGDSQIKLHGIRIELREIEAVLVENSAGVLLDAVVSVRRNPDFLVGHVKFAVPLDGAEQDDFLSMLLARLPLPKHMCPALLVPLESIPINAHGKTDRSAIQALPLPVGASSDEELYLNETEQTLKDIWTQVLPEECTRAVAIRPETDFFSLGGGSYLLVLVQRLVRSRLNVSIPLTKLFDSSSLRGMASKISAQTSIAAINWEVETALDTGLHIESQGHQHTLEPAGKVGGLTVVLTGASGYLGKAILKALAKHTAVSDIHCVAVRGEGRVLIDAHDETMARVTVHEGDLAAPLLGLTTEAFDKIAHDADVIVHSGANRSFWDYFQTLRGANVTSTKTLVKMAAVGRTPLHFISSGGLVPVNHDEDNPNPGSVTGMSEPPPDGSNGYLATKWASEAYLEKAGHELSLPVYIHRVTAAPHNGAGSAGPPEDLVTEFVDLATELKAVPQPRGWRGSFDILRTSELSQQLAEKFTSSKVESTGDAESSSNVHYIHYPSTVHLEMSDVAAALDAALQAATHGESPVEGFETLPPQVWVGKAKKAGIDWHFAGQDFGAAGAEGVTLKR